MNKIYECLNKKVMDLHGIIINKKVIITTWEGNTY